MSSKRSILFHNWWNFTLNLQIFIEFENYRKNLTLKILFLEKIRVGKNYQVVVPEMIPMPETYPDKALLVWSPAKWIPESKLDEYITLAKESYSYNSEQALGMLFHIFLLGMLLIFYHN